ncbi:MAG: aspartate kinase [bacterium]|nr:aspartate kinase [bacterium]
MIVCKFGGSSLADAKSITKVAKIIKEDARRKMIVVSAPGKRFSDDIKITDYLYNLHSYVNEKEKFEKTFNTIQDRFLIMAEELGIDNKKLKNMLKEIKQKILKGESIDYVVSRGEYLNAVLIAEYLGFDFVDASEFVRINHNGSIDPETYSLGKELFCNRENCVIPGFFGLNHDKKFKTFSRGGSDITGSIVANVVNAECYENWTDVSGLLLADPRVVPSAMSVPEITYRELREMACIGANVFHQEAIVPAKTKRIPIKIKNTNAPGDLGTTISTGRDSTKMPIVGVSGKKHYIPVSVEKMDINAELIKSIEERLATADYTIEFTQQSFDSVTFYIHDSDQFDKKEINKIVSSYNVDKVIFNSKVAMIGIVGIGRSWNNLNKLLTNLEGVNIEAMDFGGSNTSSFIAVKDQCYHMALNKIAQGINNLC